MRKEIFVYIAVMMTACSLILAAKILVMVDDITSARDLTDRAQQAIGACEKDLPRSQKCKIVISAEVVE